MELVDGLIVPSLAIVTCGNDVGKLKGFAFTTMAKDNMRSKDAIIATRKALIIIENRL